MTLRPSAWRSTVSSTALLRLSSCTAQLLHLLQHHVDGPSTAADTWSLRPRPISSTVSGSQATTTTLPGQPPTAFTNRNTVWGSMAWGLIISPSSKPPLISSWSGSITYSVPGSPPWRLVSTRISAP